MKYPPQSDNAGKLVLRLTLGILLLLHGIAKAASPEAMAAVHGMVAAKGLPSFVAYGAYVGEILAPLMILLGVFCRIGGLLATVNMVFAIALAHTAQIFTLGKQGGWALELQGFYLFCGVAVFLLGSGRYALKPD